jgi:tetratricopeptide (TPR) repeat protein
MPPSTRADAATGVGTDDFKRAAEALRPDRSHLHPRLREAAMSLDNKQVGVAKKILQEFLKDHPREANALYLLAETAARMGGSEEAEKLLAQCVELAPDFIAARFRYANILLQANRPEAALKQAEHLLKHELRNPLFRQVRALALEGMEDFAASTAVWRELVDDYPTRLDCWERYGHALRGRGLREECIAAYRKVIALNPAYGGAWWSLADMKTYRFSAADVAQMEAQLSRGDLSPASRTQLLFALGKAQEDAKSYEASFRSYAKANALHRLGIQHDPDVLTKYVARCKHLFTETFFCERASSGCSSTDPIFLVGMPRAGSTLVEQILASHSRIEGTRELPTLAAISMQLQTTSREDYFVTLSKLDAKSLNALGGQYLESVRAHRRQSLPHFTDKMGPNFAHIGLLRMILPNARIVDVRRHPLACCFSIFAQLFPKGQNDSYRLTEIARVYRDYVDLMAHFDRVLPGKVHRVFYENLVDQPEAEVRRLLAYLGLPFEEACLQFHRTDRVVTTASSEQVRRPIYKDALEQWRNYEPWLAPLKTELGPVLDAYPGIPGFD